MYYVLDSDGVTPHKVSVDEWGKWFSAKVPTRPGRVGVLHLDGTNIMVSTVFIGLDSGLNWATGEPPLLWETAVLGLDEEYEERHASHDEAVAGYLRAITWALERL